MRILLQYGKSEYIADLDAKFHAERTDLKGWVEIAISAKNDPSRHGFIILTAEDYDELRREMLTVGEPKQEPCKRGWRRWRTRTRNRTRRI